MGPDRVTTETRELPSAGVAPDDFRDQGREWPQVGLDVRSGGDDAGELVVDRHSPVGSPEAGEDAVVAGAGVARHEALAGFADGVRRQDGAAPEILLEPRALLAHLEIGKPCRDENHGDRDAAEEPDQEAHVVGAPAGGTLPAVTRRTW